MLRTIFACKKRSFQPSSNTTLARVDHRGDVSSLSYFIFLVHLSGPPCSRRQPSCVSTANEPQSGHAKLRFPTASRAVWQLGGRKLSDPNSPVDAVCQRQNTCLAIFIMSWPQTLSCASMCAAPSRYDETGGRAYHGLRSYSKRLHNTAHIAACWDRTG